MPIRVSLASGTPKTVDFHIRALRSLKGLVTAYSTALGKYIPVPGMAVELPQLSRKTSTDSSGHYNFQDLPAGGFALIVGSDAAREPRDVIVPVGPANLHVDIKLR